MPHGLEKAQTGYGVQTKYIVRAIRDMGHDIALVCFWGLEGGTIEWEGIRCYGKQLDGYGNDAVKYAIRDFRAEYVFTLIDLWVMDVNMGNWGAKFIPLFPVDHDPLPPVVIDRLPHAYKLVVYSRFGEAKVRELGYEPIYIPHGVPCDKYYPATKDEKAEFRKKLYPDWPEDAFVVGMVAANKGYPSRKSFPEAMDAFARFAASHPDARMYLHSWPGSEFGGPQLQEMAKLYGITDRIRLLNPAKFIGGFYDDELMRQIYCSMDILINPAMGEGFGLPIIEAQSCGVSVAVTDFSSMPELVGCGWTVPVARLVPTMIWGKQAEPDVDGIVHALEQCYRRPKSDHWTEAARDFALQYDWPNVIDAYWKPFMASLEAERETIIGQVD